MNEESLQEQPLAEEEIRYSTLQELEAALTESQGVTFSRVEEGDPQQEAVRAIGYGSDGLFYVIDATPANMKVLSTSRSIEEARAQAQVQH